MTLLDESINKLYSNNKTSDFELKNLADHCDQSRSSFDIIHIFQERFGFDNKIKKKFLFEKVFSNNEEKIGKRKI